MKCYLVLNDPENKIMKVQDEDVESFKEKYFGKILLEADSVQELLINLSDKLNGEDAANIHAALSH